MKITYDSQSDALYIEFKRVTVTTKRLDEDVALDYDKKGRIAGIEILNASRRLHFTKEQPRVELRHIFASMR